LSIERLFAEGAAEAGARGGDLGNSGVAPQIGMFEVTLEPRC
jgi:hypothetical protein